MPTNLRIYGFPSHQEVGRTHGVDFARVIQPVKALNGYKDIESEVYDHENDLKHNNPLDWIGVMEKHDIFYFNYLNNPWGFAAMGMMARKNGVKIIMDIDDDIWDLHSDNSAAQVYSKGSVALNNFVSICNEVDYITTTNNYLRNVIISRTNKKPEQVVVFPNYVDLSLYKYKPEFKDTNNIILTHFGSSTHRHDLNTFGFLKAMDKIMREYPHVIFRTIGALDSLSTEQKMKWGERYQAKFGDGDIYKWVNDYFPKYMEETDILVVPLMDDIYNRCKSSIKFIESGSAGKPGIWQDIRQYREVIDGTNGMLAKDEKDWYRAIKKLIDDKELRKEMGENAYKTIKENWQIQDHLEEYHQFFTKALDNK